jgi:nucleoside-diphosphate-sugar epimerase
MSDYILLTGMTGQIGRYLLRDLLLEGRQLAVLVRPIGERSAQQRVNEIVEQWEEEIGTSLPLPVCLEGDTSREFFGLNQHNRRWVRKNCRTLLHNAASVEFGGNNGHTWDNNIQGAQRAIEVCHLGAIDHLLYVSTAYVCGKHDRTFYEDDLQVGQTFRNEYEHSKFAAEQLLRKARTPDLLTVLRPGIVVGDHSTGYSKTFHSFYRYVQFTSLLANHASRDDRGRWRHDVRINLSGHEERNFVTVDWVSAAISAIVMGTKWHGRTYHLTPSQPTMAHEVEEALEKFFQYEGVRFVGQKGLDATNSTFEEQRFYEYIAQYNDYWHDDPVFNRRNTNQATEAIPERRVDVDCLGRLIDFAVRNRFGRRRHKSALVKAD